jgi:two-component system, chemotaxis family, chemotaxis protein CheY
MKNILVVDDSVSIRELVGLTLESAGYNVDKAVDGAEAIKLLDGREINLVITDLNMPNMDGIQVIQEVRKKEGYATIPILMLTTESQGVKKEQAKAAGATGWILKPFAQEKLLDVVRKVVR